MLLQGRGELSCFSLRMFSSSGRVVSASILILSRQMVLNVRSQTHSRVQTELPTTSYTVLEGRTAIGGTWDLFRYPGIRSDSDLHTFGFPWRPWLEDNTIASGSLILKYVRESAAEFGIDKKIQFSSKVTHAAWSSKTHTWTLSVQQGEKTKQVTCRWCIWSTGYYDYDTPLQAQIPGIDNFEGERLHPQFWPEDFDGRGKKVVVIGSGATAITLIPNLADQVEKITMLQRSPTYIVAMPKRTPGKGSGVLASVIRMFPASLTAKLTRWAFLVFSTALFTWCRRYPERAKKIIRKGQQKMLPEGYPMDPDFAPSYNPWEQRLCVCPDGDFFKCLKSGKAEIVTAKITQVTKNSIVTDTGVTIPADVIVTATGLKMVLAGKATFSVDGEPLAFNDKFMWKGSMLQDVPNAAFVAGYTMASWTLGADCTASQTCRLIKYLESHGYQSATPRVTGEKKNMKPGPWLNLNSTYVQKAKGELPKAGDQAPWLPRQNYLTDYWMAKWGTLSQDMQFE